MKLTVVDPVPANLTPVVSVEVNCVVPPTFLTGNEVVLTSVGIAQTLSPRKNVEELAVPVALRSAEIVPVEVIVPPETFTNAPLLVATEVTVPVN